MLPLEEMVAMMDKELESLHDARCSWSTTFHITFAVIHTRFWVHSSKGDTPLLLHTYLACQDLHATHANQPTCTEPATKYAWLC